MEHQHLQQQQVHPNSQSLHPGWLQCYTPQTHSRHLNFVKKILWGYKLSVPLSFTPSPSATFSLLCETLLSTPPLSSDPIVNYSFNNNPCLFAILSSIYVSCFASLLEHHPNQHFVKLSLCGFSHGFWPIATLPTDTTINNPNHPSWDNHLNAITKFCDKEVLASRHFHSFSILLPRVKVSPLFVPFKKALLSPTSVLIFILALHISTIP